MGRNANLKQAYTLIVGGFSLIRISTPWIVTVLNLSVCQTVTSSAKPPIPAKMHAATTSSVCVEQIEDAVKEATNRTVVLTALTFDNNDALRATPAQLRNSNGVILNGRLLEAPHTFRLLKSGDTCIIKYERERVMKSLSACICSPYL